MYLAMRTPRKTGDRFCSWAGWHKAARLGAIPVMLLSLTVSLASRTFHLTLSHHPVVESSVPHQAVRQHLDRDAVEWTPPVPRFTVLEASGFDNRWLPALSSLPDQPWHDTLYNRPPPSC
jgi:hypothetical protein